MCSHRLVFANGCFVVVYNAVPCHGPFLSLVASQRQVYLFGQCALLMESFFSVLLVCSQGTMLHSIERYMKQAIVDRHPSVSSAALVSSVVSCSLNALMVLFLLP